MSNQCGHGHLRRVCEICQRDDEIEQLKAERDTLKAAAEKGTEYVLAHINQDLKAERDAMLSALKWTIENCTYENHGDLYGYPCDCCATPIEIPAEHKAAIDAARGE